MIDPHVHLRDGSQFAKETLYHGMCIGSLAGIRAFFDMPNTDPTLTSRDMIESRLKAGRQAAVQVAQATGRIPFYGVYGGLTAEPDQIRAMVAAYEEFPGSVVGFKLFAGHSTGDMGVVEEVKQRSVYRTLVECGYKGVLAVHCEKESMLRPDLWDADRPESHCVARPPEAEIQSVADQISFVKESGFAGNLHICHISTDRAISLVEAARRSGMRITCGATAHHALLDDSIAHMQGNLLKMNPPVRSVADQQAVLQGLLSGTIDWIESDHAPHTLEDKKKGASGIPGFAGTLLLIKRLRTEGIDEFRLTKLCGGRIQEIFGIAGLRTEVPTNQFIDNVLMDVRSAYPWDPFCTIK
jgi:dihydroorotase